MARVLKGMASDLDDTLADTKIGIVRALIERFGNDTDLTPEQMIEKYGYTYHIPQYQTPEATAFLDELINNPAFYLDIPLLPSAKLGLQQLAIMPGLAAYITIRPHNTAKASREWIASMGLPPRPVVSRPKELSYQEGNAWKASYLNENRDDILGIVDDNPEIVAHLPPDYPGMIIIYGNQAKNPNGLNVHTVSTWEEVKELTTKKRLKT